MATSIEMLVVVKAYPNPSAKYVESLVLPASASMALVIGGCASIRSTSETFRATGSSRSTSYHP